jgi:phosphate transport system ATP-binding protein
MTRPLEAFTAPDDLVVDPFPWAPAPPPAPPAAPTAPPWPSPPPAPPVAPALRVAERTSSATGPAWLEADHVSCWFGPRQVLDDVNLAMPPGQITALIGPSGCGKSTFLRSLNRMHELVPGSSLAGSIRLNGEDIYGAEMPPTTTRLRIGMVFQRPNPFPAMSISQNVLAGLRLSGTGVKGGRDTVEWALRRAGLWNETKDRLNASGASLSGGQQQRLCIARSLAVRPQVLLMDEPCSALDPISTRVIEDTMMALKDEVTIVIVTHNMQQAGRVSDQCALFLVDSEGGAGHIVEAGPTSAMFSTPRDPRTADYIAGRFG